VTGLQRLADIVGPETAFRLMTDGDAGTTVLSHDPREDLADLQVLEAQPA
jgi:hypothetical protein